MALRDKIVVTTHSPRKVHTVAVTSPGGTVVFSSFGEDHILVSERTRVTTKRPQGREKRAMLFARDSVVLLEVINA